MKALTQQFEDGRTGQDYGSLLWVATELRLTIAPAPELRVILQGFRDAEHVRSRRQPIPNAERRYRIAGPDALTRLEEILAGNAKLDAVSVQLARDTADVVVGEEPVIDDETGEPVIDDETGEPLTRPIRESFFEGATETDVNLREEEPRP